MWRQSQLPLTYHNQAAACIPGLGEFLLTFLPSAAQLLRPLRDALDSSANGSSPVSWSDSMKKIFLQTKAAVASAITLAHAVAGALLSLMVDSSATRVGEALQLFSSLGANIVLL
jgi:hypothetical protein